MSWFHRCHVCDGRGHIKAVICRICGGRGWLSDAQAARIPVAGTSSTSAPFVKPK